LQGNFDLQFGRHTCFLAGLFAGCQQQVTSHKVTTFLSNKAVSFLRAKLIYSVNVT